MRERLLVSVKDFRAYGAYYAGSYFHPLKRGRCPGPGPGPGQGMPLARLYSASSIYRPLVPSMSSRPQIACPAYRPFNVNSSNLCQRSANAGASAASSTHLALNRVPIICAVTHSGMGRVPLCLLLALLPSADVALTPRVGDSLSHAVLLDSEPFVGVTEGSVSAFRAGYHMPTHRTRRVHRPL